jgi:hypothetical protein
VTVEESVSIYVLEVRESVLNDAVKVIVSKLRKPYYLKKLKANGN